jgi:hypothetical protein
MMNNFSVCWMNNNKKQSEYLYAQMKQVFSRCVMWRDERAYTRTEVGVGRKDGKYKD